MHHKHKNTLT